MPAVPTRAVPLLAAILCSLTSPLACRKQDAPAPRERQETVVPVGAVPAEAGRIRAVVHASAVVAPAEGGEFLAVPPEPARILEIAKAEGDQVHAGDMLVRFDLPSAVQDAARLNSDLTAAQAQFENARINQGRVRDFVERGLVPRRDLEVADRELADAQGAVERIRTMHAAAAASVGRAIIRAPFDGVVAARRHNPGDVVTTTSGDPVLRVVDPRRLDLIASVQEADMSRVVPGASARIAGAVDVTPVRLSVAQRLADRVSPGGTMPFRLLFAEPTQLPVDTRVEIDIDAEERTNVVLVPAEALIREDGRASVMVVSGSRAERRPVTTGIEDEIRVEITSGVRAGELVINRGHIGLADGATISVAAGQSVQP